MLPVISLDFGYIFCRVVAHYGIGDDQVMNMPLKRFWMFSESADRMNAASDIRALTVAAAVNSSESFEAKRSELVSTVGTIVVKDFKKDIGSMNRLKAMLSN